MAKAASMGIDDDMRKSSARTGQTGNMAFERLPDEIIEQILLLTSPNAFASSILLNRKWRAVSQQAHLYAHHLSRCPSYSAAHHAIIVPDNTNSLPQLRRLFTKEIKRNLFEAYLRPHETVISLVSTSISSSSAPGGEAFHFSLSPKGRYILAYSSSRIHVIDVTGSQVVVKRELKILRRPASTTITDDGSLLAVLSTDLQVDLYDLTGNHPRHSHSVALDHTPRTIALSPTGAVLAAAYDSGVEVSSLDPDHTTTERRAVKSYAVDSLSFSRDGTQLLGSTVQSLNPSTVVLTAPYYNAGTSLPEESVSALWTTSILFPNGSRDCSHAVLLPSTSDGEETWAFTYDRVFETFRAVRIDDLRNGTTYFTGPIADASSVSKLLPSTLPTSTQSGDLVAAGFQGALWLYGVPEDLDALPVVSHNGSSNMDGGISTPSTHLGRRNSAPSLRSITRHRDSLSRTPQWQLLCDRFRNTFVEGRKIATLDQVSAMGWVSDRPLSFRGERLVAVAPGVKCKPLFSDDDGMSPVDGGRITILDFDYTVSNGKRTSITIEVGMNDPEVLEEEHRDLDAEVAIVRRRTVAQRRSYHSHVSRSVGGGTIPQIPRPEAPPVPTIENDIGDPFVAPNILPRQGINPTINPEQLETDSLDEAQEAFDAPYSHTSPRSGTTLRRAATAAAVNRRLHPRAVAQEHIEYRRADGREEHPHESDADNWVPPPPPYSRDPVPPLPEHIQRSLLAEVTVSTMQRSNTHRAPSIDFPALDSGNLSRSRTIASTSTATSRRESYPFPRSVSDSTTTNYDRVSLEEERPRPVSSPISPEFDELYDVSPPGTPQPAPREVQPSQISRRPVGSVPISNSTSLRQKITGTLQGPISPIPQPTQVISEQLNRKLSQWEVTTELNAPLPLKRESASSQLFDKEVPPRPTEEHHLTELPPSTPNIQNQQQIIESQPSSSRASQTSQIWLENTEEPPLPLARRAETAPTTRYPQDTEDPLPIWKRSDTAPLPSARPANVSLVSSGLVMPSPDQLARLNSRQGRPSGLSDPSRRVSASSPHSRRSSSSHRPAPSWEPIQQLVSYTTNYSDQQGTPPRAAVGAYGSSTSRNSVYGSPSRNTIAGPPSHINYSNHILQAGSTQRDITPGNTRMPAPSNLRPPMERLETIHSITSNGEPSHFTPQRMSMGIGRQQSRAERSAAKNIKDARKRGWRATMYKEKKLKKEKHGDAASSSGWTDVSVVSGRVDYSGRDNRPGAKSAKCVLM